MAESNKLDSRKLWEVAHEDREYTSVERVILNQASSELRCYRKKHNLSRKKFSTILKIPLEALIAIENSSGDPALASRLLQVIECDDD